MRDGFRIIDVDRHVIEPLAMWSDYLPVQMKEYAPKLVPMPLMDETSAQRRERLGDDADSPRPQILAVQGEPLMQNVSEAAYIRTWALAQARRSQIAAAGSPWGHVAEMDDRGIDLAVLLPTFAPFLVYDDRVEAARSRAYASAYNRWLADFCACAPRRLIGAALLSRHDAGTMVADLQEALKGGFRAIVLRPNPVGGRTLGSPDYERFWAACEQNDVTVLIHEGTHTRVSTAGADRFESHFAQHACSHPFEAMMAFLSLIDGGVLEAHPTLRVAFLESGCAWLPYWLWRLDHVEYAQFRNEVRARVKRPPSEYFQRQCWLAIEPGEPLLGEVAKHIGPARFVFGTDFPHLDHDAHIVDHVLAQRDRFGENDLRSVLWDNACRLLGITASSF